MTEVLCQKSRSILKELTKVRVDLGQLTVCQEIFSAWRMTTSRIFNRNVQIGSHVLPVEIESSNQKSLSGHFHLDPTNHGVIKIFECEKYFYKDFAGLLMHEFRHAIQYQSLRKEFVSQPCSPYVKESPWEIDAYALEHLLGTDALWACNEIFKDGSSTTSLAGPEQLYELIVSHSKNLVLK